ncbi:MAG: beta/gamma crystallin-related protein [Planctomycetota bacterium]|nr:beta/gamma crystallin-related protein [Planctomycetota bacterium]
MPVVNPHLIVELYEGWGYSGKRAVLMRPVPHLDEIGMMDRVFSVRVFKGPGYRMSPNVKVVLYDQPMFQGNRLALGPGAYPNLQDVVKRFRTVQSIQFESVMDTGGPEWGEIPVIIEVYAGANFTGRKATIIRDMADAHTIGGNNIISSFKIYKGPNFPKQGARVTFYEGLDFSGTALPIMMGPADYVKSFPDLKLLPQSFDNRISSIQIEGWTEKTQFDTRIFEDAFDGETLAQGWEWVDPNGGGDWRSEQGFLRMNVESGQDLWFGANYDAPRLIRQMTGDFAIETRLPVEAALKEHGGLLVWKNEHRFLRIDKTCGAHAWGGDVRFERHQWRTSELLGRGAGMRNANNLYLRLERNGDVFTGFASEDGQKWLYCGSTVMGMSEPVHVGLYALAPGNVPPTTTRFDFFRVYRRKRDVALEQREQERFRRQEQTWQYRRFIREL